MSSEISASVPIIPQCVSSRTRGCTPKPDRNAAPHRYVPCTVRPDVPLAAAPFPALRGLRLLPGADLQLDLRRRRGGFLGVVVLAVIGNAAEYLSAVSFARADRLGVAISVTVGSTTQVALLVAPLLVILSWLFGSPMNLVFTPLEVVAVATAAAVVSMIAADGETRWFEGVLLLAVYVLLASAFYLV